MSSWSTGADAISAPPDPALSPYTGWTRAHWIGVLARLTHGFAHHIPAGGSPARVLFPDDRIDHPDCVDGLEAFSRVSVAWAAWLRHPANPASLVWDGHAVDVAALLAQGLVDGTNPRSAAYWGEAGHMDQRLVECANIALAIHLSRERVIARLSRAEQDQVMAWLAHVDGKGTYPDNWVLFPALSQVVRLQLGYPAPAGDLHARLRRMAAFYRGDGWYVDGPGDEFDLYNAWMFGWHFLFWAWIDGDRDPALREAVLRRARSFQAQFAHFFGGNGVYVPWGRSLGSRFGAVGTFALGHLLGIAPPGPGLLRRLSSGCLGYFVERGLFHPRGHFFTQGFHGHHPPALESYVSPGSPLSAAQGLLALSFDPEDPFWTAVEEPLPVEQADFELVLPAPGFVVSGRRATGQVLLLNSRGGHVEDVARADYPPKYGKLSYSTHFPLNVVPAAGSYAPDAMLSLQRAGHWGHRVLTQQGGVAPGLAWSQFDQAVAGEPQPMWTAALLWGDLQVILAVVHPTRPVQAHYAPGALGAAGPAGIVRCSDLLAGWEYAEAGGRALGVRRLLGFSSQAPSAPFLGRSNLNLAYPYAEQPLVFEAEASVTPRCLAAVGLARPAPFEPGTALAGFAVSADAGGRFTVGFPDGEQAWVALTTEPQPEVALAGALFAGPAVRYARLQPGLAACAGAGVTHVGGVAAFDTPAVFRLARAAGSVHLSLDGGVRLDPTWLGPGPHSLEVQALSGEWVPLAAESPGHIPTRVVRVWQARLERTQIDFRFRR